MICDERVVSAPGGTCVPTFPGNHPKRTEELLFDYYLPASVRQHEVFTPFPFYLDGELHREMADAASTLYGLVMKILDGAAEEGVPPFDMGDFPLLGEILALPNRRAPFFWARFDAFRRRGGGVFFSEFNFDKPCGQREVVLAERFGTPGNPSEGFCARFREGFVELLRGERLDAAKARAVILVDPAHTEEMHLAMLYRDLLEETGCAFVIAGSGNLSVRDGRVRAFDEPVDVILRQYPAEFLHEVGDMGEILRLAGEGRVLIVNDPRAILGQAKSLFSYLWELAARDDPLLTPAERDAVRATVPHTVLLTPALFDEARARREAYVIKAVYGRYSEEVYIGCACSPAEWDEVLAWVAESGRPHVLQEYCPIETDEALRLGPRGYESREAFVNYGVYFINGRRAGLNVRFSPDRLTADETVWCAPVAVREKSLRVREYGGADRDEAWSEICEEAAFGPGYTGGWTGCLEAFSLDSLELEAGQYEEIRTASERLVPVFQAALEAVRERPSLLCPVLGIPAELTSLVTSRLTDRLAFLGRMDWVYDASGALKLLEFNAETPAGIMESTALTELLAARLGRRAESPNRELGRKIADSFGAILADYSRSSPIRTVGLVTGAYYEDWYTTLAVYDAVRSLPYTFVLGEVSGLEAKGGKLHLEGSSLDAVYRYYPLDWFAGEPRFDGVIEAMASGTPSVNPPSTLLCQSKAFFAFLWELAERRFFDDAQAASIRKYIPFTSLSPEAFHNGDYCVKPLFGREGEGVSFSLGGATPRAGEDAVYQERLDLQSVALTVRTSYGSERRAAYPVIGAWIAGDRFAGIFTRAGTRVTDKWALFIPTFVRFPKEAREP